MIVRKGKVMVMVKRGGEREVEKEEEGKEEEGKEDEGKGTRRRGE